jgi:hypothetical protein
MDNKYITIALVAAICVSLGGTFITLNKLSEVGSMTQITGYDISDTGQGRIQVQASVSILVNATGTNLHDDIYFGQCTPYSGHYINLTSNASNGEADSDVGAYGNCTGEAFPDFIHVYNIGNTDANVTIASSMASDTFIPSATADALFGYITTNIDRHATSDTHSDGCTECTKVGANLCAGTAPANVTQWTEFTDTSTRLACNNLTYARGAGEKPPGFATWLMVQVPTSAFASTSVTTATLTYTAAQVI